METPIASPLKISTMTGLTKLNCDINLSGLYEFLSENDNVLYIEYGENYKGFSKKNTKKKRKKKENKTFYNQLTLIIYSEIYKKNINVKLFNNGNIQFTGLKNKYCGEKTIEYIIEYINESIFENEYIKETIIKNPIQINTDTPKLVYNPLRIVLINSDFDLGFNINRENLYKVIISDGLFASYEPCIYPGVNIKFYYNLSNKLENGICYCNESCNGKGCGCGDSQCKRITICVFESGKSIITGAQDNIQLVQAFIYIKSTVYEYLDYIKA